MASCENLADSVIIGMAVRAIRLDRRMRPSEVARLMDIPLRTYEHLEGGRARVALMTCVPLRDPLFALHCADNRAAGVMMMALAELHEKLGPDMSLIDIKTMIGAVTKVCRELEEHIQKRDLFAERWMNEKSAKYDGIPLTNLRPRPK
jgi:hypothetical protein